MPKPRIPCKRYRDQSSDHIEYGCDYDTGIDCEFCVINGGKLSPVTGKPFRGNIELYRASYNKRHNIQADKPILIKLKGTTLCGHLKQKKR